MRKCVLGLFLVALGVVGSTACSSSDKGTKVDGVCASFCQAFDSGTNCSGAKTQCSNDCDSVVSHCPARADAMLGCLAGLGYSCTAPGEAHATGSSGTAGSPATLSSGAGTLYVFDAYCAGLVQEFNDCTPVSPGGGGTSGSGGGGGTGGDGGSGNSPSGGGSGGSGAGGAGGSGGGGQPDLADVEFQLSVTTGPKDPNGEGGPLTPWVVNVCIEPSQGDYVQVSNSGTGDATPFAMAVQLLKDGTAVDSCEDLVESDPLPPGYSTSWSNPWCCVLDDTVSTFDLNPRTIRVRADVSGQVAELDESNNDKLGTAFDITGK
jgi:hypothetical protein